MPVEVVGRQIQKNGNVRAKRIDPFELEAAELGHGNALIAGFIRAPRPPRESDERRANISGNHRRRARARQNMADERSRRRFSIRAGHADQPSSQEAPAQFDFAPDRHARGARRQKTWVVRRHSRAGHDQILRRHRGQRAVARSAPKIKRAAERPQLRHGLAELLGGAIVDGCHQGAPRRAELRRGDACARQSQHQHALACEFDSRTHRYLSFKVVNENSAKTSATIQKRTMIFDSLQPASSK